MVRALAETADAKGPLLEDIQGTGDPVQLVIMRVCHYPAQNIIMRAMANYKGKPWFDYVWIRVDDSQIGSEKDPFGNKPDDKRMLVRLWGFTKWYQQDYAFVDYFQRIYSEGHGVRPHPMLRKYKYYQYRPGVLPSPPFYAIKVSSIIGTAVVFDDPDFEEYPSVSAKQILYVPSIVELMESQEVLPGEGWLEAPPQVPILADAHGSEKKDYDEVVDSDQEVVDDA